MRDLLTRLHACRTFHACVSILVWFRRDRSISPALIKLVMFGASCEPENHMMMSRDLRWPDDYRFTVTRALGYR